MSEDEDIEDMSKESKEIYKKIMNGEIELEWHVTDYAPDEPLSGGSTYLRGRRRDERDKTENK